MTLDAFVTSRRERWEDLETLLATCRRGRRLGALDSRAVERLGGLYRAAASDLALARRDFPGEPVTGYLNDLCARAHPLLFRQRSPSRDRWLGFLLAEIPRSFRAHRRHVLLSLALLLAGVVSGWLAVDLRPDLRQSLVPQSGFDQLARGELRALPSAPALGTFIIVNNVRVAAVCFLGGALAGVPTVLLLLANGWMLGSIAAAVHGGGYDMSFWPLIAPHGVLELSVIVIAGAAGLAVGEALLRPGLRRRGDAFSAAARESVTLALGAASLLVVAGLIEAYVSPAQLPAALKLAVGATVGAALYAWLLLGGRPRHRPPQRRLGAAGPGAAGAAA